VADAVAAYRAAVEERAKTAEAERAAAAARAEEEARTRQEAEARAQAEERARAAAEAEAREQRKRRRLQLALAAALALLLLGGGAFAWWQDRQDTKHAADQKVREAEATALAVERDNERRIKEEAARVGVENALKQVEDLRTAYRS